MISMNEMVYLSQINSLKLTGGCDLNVKYSKNRCFGCPGGKLLSYEIINEIISTFKCEDPGISLDEFYVEERVFSRVFDCFKDQNICSSCTYQGNCNTCSQELINQGGLCLEKCLPGKFHKNGICIENCGPEYYGENRECKKCHQSCKNCIGPAKT